MKLLLDSNAVVALGNAAVPHRKTTIYVLRWRFGCENLSTLVFRFPHSVLCSGIYEVLNIAPQAH